MYIIYRSFVTTQLKNCHFFLVACKKSKNIKKKKERKNVLLFLYSQLLHQNCISKLILQNFNDSKYSNLFSGKLRFLNYVVILANKRYIHPSNFMGRQYEVSEPIIDPKQSVTE